MPSHLMHLLRPLTLAERTTHRHPWAYGRGRLPARSSAFVRKGAIFFFRQQRKNCHCHFAGVDLTLTLHTHGHGALYGHGERTVAGIAFQWPAVVRTQGGKPVMEKQRHKEERGEERDKEK